MVLLSSQTWGGGTLNPLIIFLGHYNGVSIPKTAMAGVKRLSLVEMQFQYRNATARYPVRAIYARSEVQSMRRTHVLQFTPAAKRSESRNSLPSPLPDRAAPDLQYPWSFSAAQHRLFPGVSDEHHIARQWRDS